MEGARFKSLLTLGVLMVAVFSVGIGVGYMSYRYINVSLAESNGFDYDGDGVFEEEYTYFGDLLLTVKVDRNKDGVFDLVTTYGSKGMLKQSAIDDDFDGAFESIMDYKSGNPSKIKTDTNSDMKTDLIVEFENGVVTSSRIIDQKTNKTIIRYFYRLGKIIASEKDIDLDGKIDESFEYNYLEEKIRQDNTNK
jgi:hypothetical protein